MPGVVILSAIYAECHNSVHYVECHYTERHYAECHNGHQGPIIKLITAIIYSFCNKLECLSLNTRLDWKGLPGTNTLAYYGNCKLRP
jgi:hypothetical protein